MVALSFKTLSPLSDKSYPVVLNPFLAKNIECLPIIDEIIKSEYNQANQLRAITNGYQDLKGTSDIFIAGFISKCEECNNIKLDIKEYKIKPKSVVITGIIKSYELDSSYERLI